MTTALPTAESFLSGGVGSAKFDKPGDTITGRITSPPEVQQQRDFQSGQPKFWDDGKPMAQLRVILATDQRDPTNPEDDGERALYVRGKMQAAVSDAVRKSGAKHLEVGGTLTVTYSADGEAKQRGFNPPKLYTAQYVPASAGEQAAFLGTETPAQQSAAQPVAQQPAAAAPMQQQFTPEQLAAMKAAGVDVTQFGG